jgi:hypothetical protein
MTMHSHIPSYAAKGGDDLDTPGVAGRGDGVSGRLFSGQDCSFGIIFGSDIAAEKVLKPETKKRQRVFAEADTGGSTICAISG